MYLKNTILYVFVLYTLKSGNCNVTDGEEDKFEILFRKIQVLEEKNVLLERRIDSEVKELNERISELETNCGREAESDNDLVDGEEMDNRLPRSVLENRLTRRQEGDTEVAFFAVVTPHDVQHLGVNQNIVFDQADTNIGNGYHASHGLFTAPVDGTYVFFATVTGKHLNDNTDYYAHFDINGRSYAKFITFPNEQSSQMIIVQLTQGDDVSVKNNLPDDHVLGSTFSTFSGFLLYQSPGLSIIG